MFRNRLSRLFSNSDSRVTPEYSGDFANWDDALVQSAGYESEEILKKTIAAYQDFESSATACYERDSVVFDQPEYNWPLLSSLYKIGMLSHNLTIMDFGGSLGSTYFQHKALISNLVKSWHVIELSELVKFGKNQINESQLFFHDDLTQCLRELDKRDLLVFSSSLQYLRDPYNIVASIMETNFSYILIDRTRFISTGQDQIAIQRVPEHIYKASYPVWFFDEGNFKDAFDSRYELIYEFPSYCDERQGVVEGEKYVTKGMLYKLRIDSI